MRFSTFRNSISGILLAMTVASCGGGDGPTQPPPQSSAPSAPGNVQVTTAADGALSVSWTGSANATSHTIYMASRAGVTKANYNGLPDGRRIQNATTPTTVSNLDGKTYYFVVTASNSSGESIESAEASATPEVALNLQADRQLSGGTYTYTSMDIGAGSTLTVTGPVIISVTGDATVDGTVTGDCQAIEVRVDGDFTLDGLLTNICSAAPSAAGPGLTVVADGELTIGSAVSNEDAIVSDGSIVLTDSATESANLDPLFDTEAAPSPSLSGPARQAGGGAAGVNRPIRARRGGSEVRVSRSGDVLINGDIEAADGANAPPKMEAPVCDNSSAFGGTGGSVRLAAPGGRLFIGVGARIEAGDGGKGGDCTADAEGADAVSTAGQGGNGGSVLVGGQTVEFEGNVTLVRGNGGPGGDAFAFGGDAQQPCEDGYQGTSTGGKGGKAGGIGYIIESPGTINGAPTEEGANGGKGGLAEATGGAGADCVCGMGDGSGGDGGIATANGGMGGDGARGNIWTLGADSHKKGEGGDADALGGPGGNGADCCAEKRPGGNGGKGGDATATGGDMGTRGIGGDSKIGAATSVGGDGGNGGDGLGPGSGGSGGTANSSGDPVDETNGQDGADGELCADLDIWFIYFSSIQDGSIAPGSSLVLNTYDYEQTMQTGTVTARFQTAEEAGQTSVQYQKSGDFIGMGPGVMVIDLSSVLPGFPTALASALLDIFCMEANCVELVGYYQGQEVARVGSHPWMSGQTNPYCFNTNPTSFCSQNLELPPPPAGVPHYDEVRFVARGFFWMFHWGLIIVDP